MKSLFYRVENVKCNIVWFKHVFWKTRVNPWTTFGTNLLTFSLSLSLLKLNLSIENSPISIFPIVWIFREEKKNENELWVVLEMKPELKSIFATCQNMKQWMQIELLWPYKENHSHSMYECKKPPPPPSRLVDWTTELKIKFVNFFLS